MTQTAALLTDHILPYHPIRQYVLSLPFPLRFLLATKPELITATLKIISHNIEKAIIKKAGYTQKTAETGGVTFIQRFGSALNLNIHLHMLFLDGVYLKNHKINIQQPTFIPIKAPNTEELTKLLHQITNKLINHLEQTG